MHKESKLIVLSVVASTLIFGASGTGGVLLTSLIFLILGDG